MEALEARLNSGWDINSERSLMKEFYYLPQLTGVLGHMRGKWIYVSLYLIICNAGITAMGAVQFAMAAYTLLDKEFSIASFLIQTVCGYFLVFASFILILTKRSDLIYFWKNCDFKGIPYDDNYDAKMAETWIEVQEKKRKKIIIGFCIHFLTMASQVIIFNELFDKIQNKTPKDAYIENVYVKLAIPCWFPFKLEEKYAKYFFWLYVATVHSVILVTLFTMMILIFTAYAQVNVQIKILIDSIEQIEQRAINSCFKKYDVRFKREIQIEKLYKDPTFIKEYELCIIQNFQHHQRIRRIQAILDSIQCWPMFILTFILSAAIACSFLTIMKGDTRISSFSISLMLLILEMIALVILCDGGQQLIDLGDELIQCFYKLQWIYLPHNIKKDIMIFQEVSKTYMAYRAGGMYRTDWEYFTSIMNAAYTYFNLIYATQND